MCNVTTPRSYVMSPAIVRHLAYLASGCEVEAICILAGHPAAAGCHAVVAVLIAWWGAGASCQYDCPGSDWSDASAAATALAVADIIGTDAAAEAAGCGDEWRSARAAFEAFRRAAGAAVWYPVGE